MHDVAIRRRPAALVIAALLAMLVVGGVMLFGMGKPAQAQESACLFSLCLDKRASPSTAEVGEPITFTITERCLGPGPFPCFVAPPLVDTLPSGLTVDSVDPAGCSTSGNTVTCSFLRTINPGGAFTLTIVATPTECGTFTNTASDSALTVEAPFTVAGCLPTTKAQCKRGGWKEFGYPDQGTCISDVNRRNR